MGVAEEEESDDTCPFPFQRVTTTTNTMATDIDSNSSSEMAFPVPSHLPRRAAPPTTSAPTQTPAQSQSQDVTSKILSTMDLATTKSLTASVAVKWIEELDESMQETKVRAN